MDAAAWLDRILGGENITAEEAYALTEASDEEILEGAHRITERFVPKKFDACSIVNARSGGCSEDCKWCAQSGKYKTPHEAAGLVKKEDAVGEAEYNHRKGVHRFSLVSSGRAAKGAALRHFCDIYRTVKERTGMYLCASMGLIDADDLQALWDSGVRRYHCNLESAPSYFGELCTTHSIEEKIETLKAAKRIGFEICSGGIIGMGETEKQRVELALKLREVEPDSVPINVLSPIKGTPLEGERLIEEREIVRAVGLFRWIHPKAELRFAGGRARMSRAAQEKALWAGINSAVVGDMLTTVGSGIEADRELVGASMYETF